MNLRMHRIDGFSVFEKQNGLVVFTLGTEVVAMACYYERSDHKWLLDAIEVRNDRRGWGVGRAAMNLIAIDVLAHKGILLKVVADASIAGFYRRLGMTEVFQNNFEGDLAWLGRMGQWSHFDLTVAE